MRQKRYIRVLATSYSFRVRLCQAYHYSSSFSIEKVDKSVGQQEPEPAGFYLPSLPAGSTPYLSFPTSSLALWAKYTEPETLASKLRLVMTALQCGLYSLLLMVLSTDETLRHVVRAVQVRDL